MNAISAAAVFRFSVLLIRKSKKELDRQSSKKDPLCSATGREMIKLIQFHLLFETSVTELIRS